MIHFVTFSNTGFMDTSLIHEQAKEFNIFDKISIKNENDIPEFIKKHETFINNNKPGYGFWIWKPKIILDTLNEMNENDILIYADAGMYLNVKGKERLNYYLSLLNNNDVITFSAGNKYKAIQYVKIDAILSYYPKLALDMKRNGCYSGIIIMKKTDKTINLINDWLMLCENYHFLDKSPSVKKELFCYCGNDGDNGLFNLVLAKHKIHYEIPHTETNVYNEEDIQLHHTNIDVKTIDWSKLDDKPFQARRLTPKWGFHFLKS